MRILHSLIGHCTIAVIVILSALTFCFSAFALNVTKNELSVYEKSDGVIINSSDAIEIDNTITPDITFSQLDDYITYKFTLSNDDDSLYHITSVTDNNTNTNITTSYSYDDTTSASDKDIYVAPPNDDDGTPTDDDTPADDTDDIPDIVIPNTSGEVNDGSHTPTQGGTNSPATGNQTFPKTLSINTPSQTNIIPIVLSILLTCIAAGILYFVLRKLYSHTNFSLAKFSHSRQALHATISLVATGLLVTGGVIGITHAIDSSSLVLSFDLSKVQIIAYPTGTRTVEFNANSPNAIIDAADTTSTCDLYFNRTTCEVTIPSFTATAGYEALGWSTDANAHEALYHPGDSVSISADTPLYAITRKSLLATFVNQHTTYFTINKDSDSCYTYNNETS